MFPTTLPLSLSHTHTKAPPPTVLHLISSSKAYFPSSTATTTAAAAATFFSSSSRSSMGFPSVCYTVILPRPLAVVVHLLDRVKLAVSMALFYLGFSSSYEDFFAYPLQLPDFPSSAIKSRLPVVRFATLGTRPIQGGEAVCAVCLGTLETRHEVRELGNCSHAFHKGCIDKWVDIGQLTCPLCRAQLLPKGREEGGVLVAEHST